MMAGWAPASLSLRKFIGLILTWRAGRKIDRAEQGAGARIDDVEGRPCIGPDMDDNPVAGGADRLDLRAGRQGDVPGEGGSGGGWRRAGGGARHAARDL